MQELRRTLHRMSVDTSVGRALRKAVHLGRRGYFRAIGDERSISAFHSREFYLRDVGKRDAYARRRLYMDDEGAAVCYAFGIDYLAYRTSPPASDFRAEVARMLALRQRTPQLVLNVGAGLGMIDAAFAHAGVPCIGVDPSPGAKEGYARTFADWLDSAPYRFVGEKAHVAVEQLGSAIPDTVIMCESIEHIPAFEFDLLWKRIVPMLRVTRGLFIVTNGLSEAHFPVVVDGTGWCHIRQIDDRLYDTLASAAQRTLFRHRSHLVLQF